MSELRAILRGLGSSWLSTLPAVFCLALGTAAVAAMVTLMRGAFFAPLPFPEGDRLMRVWRHEPPAEARLDLSYPDVRLLRTEPRSFDAVEATALARKVFLSSRAGRRVEGEAVTSGYFSLLGVRPLVGRLFSDEEYRGGGPDVVVLSYEAASRLFGAEPSVYGRQIRAQDGVLTVVGVLPPSFGGTVESDAGEIEFWVPMDQYVDPSRREDPATGGIWAIARRARSSTLDQADAELADLGERMAATYPATHDRSTYRSEPFGDNWRSELRRGAWLVMGAALGLLLVAALNASTLLLARGLDRRRDEAIRLALGATPARLARRAFVESLVVVLAGGALGVASSQLLMTLMLRQSALTLPTYITLRPDALTMGSVVLILSVVALLAGTAPAILSSHVRLRGALDSESSTISESRRSVRTWSSMAVAQVAGTVILVAGSLTLLRTWQADLNTDLGFRTGGLLRMSIFLSPEDAGDAATIRSLQRRIHDAVAATPGVASLGMLWPTVPLPRPAAVPVRWTGMPEDLSARGIRVGLFAADPAAFHVLRIQPAAGRLFAASDDEHAAPVAVLSRSLAERLAPGGIDSALSRQVTIGSETLRVVGVVEDAHFGGPFEDEAHRYELYRPLAQFPRNIVSLFMEIPGDLEAYVPTLSTQIARIAPTSAIDWTGPVDHWIHEQLGETRFLALLFTLFAGTCLVLTGVGILGITASGVVRRTRELAIRQALGATPAALQFRIVARAVRLAVAGAIVGVGGAVILAPLMRTTVGDLQVTDPATLLVAAIVLVAATAATAWIPSRRVTRIHPATALKGE